MSRRSWEDIGVEEDGITLYDKRNGLPILPPSQLSQESLEVLADTCGVWLMLNHMREGQDIRYVDDFRPARAFCEVYGHLFDYDSYHPKPIMGAHRDNIPRRVRLFELGEVIRE